MRKTRIRLRIRKWRKWWLKASIWTVMMILQSVKNTKSLSTRSLSKRNLSMKNPNTTKSLSKKSQS